MNSLHKLFTQYLPAPIAAALAALVTFIAQYKNLDITSFTSLIDAFNINDVAIPAAVGAFAYQLRQTPTTTEFEPLTNDELTQSYDELTHQVVGIEQRLVRMEDLARIDPMPPSIDYHFPPIEHPKDVPRNLRNNNPLNIKLNPKNQWRGKGSGNDKTFETFSSPVYGIRAAATLLRNNYFRRHKLDTVEKIIKRWAPVDTVGGDNTPLQVKNYIKWVELAMARHFSPDYFDKYDPIDLYNDDALIALIKAMGEFEGGEPLPYTDDTYRKAIDMVPTPV